jgi:hypothetical protein
MLRINFSPWTTYELRAISALWGIVVALFLVLVLAG